MNSLFSQEKINNKRQVELDVAKGIAIIFMIWVHVKEYYMSLVYEGSLYDRVSEFCGSPPTAPVFMLILGISVHYARNNTYKALAKRGGILLLISYTLNFIRDTVPLYIQYRRDGDKEILEESLYSLVGVDILTFAGLVFLFLALVKKWNLNNKEIFVVWCMLCTANILLKAVTLPNQALNVIFAPIWQTYDYSWFPFLSWFSFPLAGYVLGGYLIRCKDKKIFYKSMAIISGAVSIPLWIYSYFHHVRFGAFGNLWQDEYYGQDILGNLVLTAFALFWISMIYFIVPYIPTFIVKILTRWSKNINRIYCISYVLLGFGLLVIEGQNWSPLRVSFLAVGFFILTDIICWIYEKLLADLQSKQMSLNGAIRQ